MAEGEHGVPNPGARLVVWAKWATGDETAVGFRSDAPQAMAATVAVYRGVDASDPVEALTVDSNHDGADLELGGIDATLPEERLVLIAGATNDASTRTWALDASMTTATASASAMAAVVVGDESLGDAAHTGTRSASYGSGGVIVAAASSTQSASAAPSPEVTVQTVGAMMALKPVPSHLSYHHDQLGSVRALTDISGKTRATYTYDPYGRTTATTGNVAQPFGYGGEHTDHETGHIYLRARHYDPTTAQFLTRDPLVSVTQDPYAYAGNDPINYGDPLGLNKCEVGLNPLRWGGNAVDCASKADPTEVVEVVNKASGVVAAGAGICTAAGAASIIGAPVAGVCGTVGAGALTVNLGTGLALTATDNKSPGSYAVDVALAGAGGVARSGAQASGRFAQANVRTGGILGWLGVPTGKEMLGELGYAFGWTGSFLTDVTSLIRSAADC